MTGEVPVLAGVTEATAGDIESTDFRDDARSDEDEGEPGQNEQSPVIEEPQNKSKTTEHFQPRQVEG